jgi:hypothetical protein
MVEAMLAFVSAWHFDFVSFRPLRSVSRKCTTCVDESQAATGIGDRRYVDRSIEHLAACQERVTRFLLSKMDPPPTKAKKPPKKRTQARHLRSVP